MRNLVLMFAVLLVLASDASTAPSGGTKGLYQFLTKPDVTMAKLVGEGYAIVGFTAYGDPSYSRIYFLLRKGPAVYSCVESRSPDRISCGQLVEPFTPAN